VLLVVQGAMSARDDEAGAQPVNADVSAKLSPAIARFVRLGAARLAGWTPMRSLAHQHRSLARARSAVGNRCGADSRSREGNHRGSATVNTLPSG
jgi:hypothetical protein